MAPEASGNYESDCAAGRAFAEFVMQDMIAKGAPNVLQFAALLLVNHPDNSGVRVGFFQAIAEYALMGY